MEQPTELEDPSDLTLPDTGQVRGTPVSNGPMPPPLQHGCRRPEVEAELVAWYERDAGERFKVLRAEIEGRRALSLEMLVHISREAFRTDDRRTLNLAFEALSKAAAPLLFSQARGCSRDERPDQVQDILLYTFQAILTNKADFAETNFAAFSLRRSIDLFRARKAKLEGTWQRVEPTGVNDPLDNVPARLPSTGALGFLAKALDRLTPKHRAAFIQYHRLGLTQEEIATHHKVDVRTIRSWLKQANATVGL